MDTMKYGIAVREVNADRVALTWNSRTGSYYVTRHNADGRRYFVALGADLMRQLIDQIDALRGVLTGNPIDSETDGDRPAVIEAIENPKPEDAEKWGGIWEKVRHYLGKPFRDATPEELADAFLTAAIRHEGGYDG